MVRTCDLPPAVAESWDWQLRGSCRGVGGAAFFVPDGERRTDQALRESQAKAVCRLCPVIQQCRHYARAVGEDVGVWGGLSAGERHVILAHRAHRPATGSPRQDGQR